MYTAPKPYQGFQPPTRDYEPSDSPQQSENTEAPQIEYQRALLSSHFTETVSANTLQTANQRENPVGVSYSPPNTDNDQNLANNNEPQRTIPAPSTSRPSYKPDTAAAQQQHNTRQPSSLYGLPQQRQYTTPTQQYNPPHGQQPSREYLPPTTARPQPDRQYLPPAPTPKSSNYEARVSSQMRVGETPSIIYGLPLYSGLDGGAKGPSSYSHISHTPQTTTTTTINHGSPQQAYYLPPSSIGQMPQQEYSIVHSEPPRLENPISGGDVGTQQYYVMPSTGYSPNVQDNSIVVMPNVGTGYADLPYPDLNQVVTPEQLEYFWQKQQETLAATPRTYTVSTQENTGTPVATPRPVYGLPLAPALGPESVNSLSSGFGQYTPRGKSQRAESAEPVYRGARQYEEPKNGSYGSGTEDEDDLNSSSGSRSEEDDGYDSYIAGSKPVDRIRSFDTQREEFLVPSSEYSLVTSSLSQYGNRISRKVSRSIKKDDHTAAPSIEQIVEKADD